MKLDELKKFDHYMQGLNTWLDKIQEHDEACRNEVIELFKKDPEYRKFIIIYAELK